jgi:5-methylcytosine-specific restriction endonuclease McrA
MNAQSLSTGSDAELIERLGVLVREERRLTATVLLHVAEVEARGLHLAAACASMFVYCTRVLGMSEDEAFKRIRAARVLRKFPVVAEAVADGRLHLTAVVLLAAHLTDECAGELVAEASGKSKAEIEILLARRAPRPDVAERLERVAAQVVLAPAGGKVVLEPVPPVPPRVAALAEERFALQLTISGATRDKLLRAQALLRHQVPSGDLSEVLDRVLDGFLDQVERKRLGKTKKPRAARPSRVKRYVPNQARREAVARDGLRCSYIAEDGRRCEETGFLEFDHVVPVALGGEASDGVRVLCRSHNQYEAERILGRSAVPAGQGADASWSRSS